MIDKIYSLRKDFMIIGLTGRTGSGCTQIAKKLQSENIKDFKTNYKEQGDKKITNQTRKDRIVHAFIKENWVKFTVFKVSDIIYYLALLEGPDCFIDQIIKLYEFKIKPLPDESLKDKTEEEQLNIQKKYIDGLQIDPNKKDCFNELKDKIIRLHEDILKFNSFIENREFEKLKVKGLPQGERSKLLEKIDNLMDCIMFQIPSFRKEFENKVNKEFPGMVSFLLQSWGNNLRKFRTIIFTGETKNDAPTFIAENINQFIKCLRLRNDNIAATRVAIDALRNPFEILYFRERYSAFYCIAVNVPEEVRQENLLKNKHFRIDEVLELDAKEGEKKKIKHSYEEIDVIRCISMADIFISHNPREENNDRHINNLLFTYISLILQPGLVTPTPHERIMQIAFTAKLNSGCLSRQVGAVVTDEKFSVKSIGWNSVPEGQVPCSLRHLEDLIEKEDENAYSEFERKNENFVVKSNQLLTKYKNIILEKIETEEDP